MTDSLPLDLPVLRGMEEAADAFARLDETVASSSPGLASLLMLRSAQAIVASRAGPHGSAADGHGAFAALLGWWYAAESREFVSDDHVLRREALALDATAEKIRGGRALTVALLREGANAENDDGDASASETVEATLRRSASESWPSLLLAAVLHSGECGQASGRSAAIARAVAPLVGGVSTDVFVVTRGRDDVPAALCALAAEARNVRQRVDAYRTRCAEAGERARGFGRGAGSAWAALDLLAGTPAITVVGAAAVLGLTVPTVAAAVERLLGAGLLREITGRGRDRVFVYEPAIALSG
ncbi:MAG: hypothetical protein AAB224_04450 [Gemmatimonadota bacterium]